MKKVCVKALVYTMCALYFVMNTSLSTASVAAMLVFLIAIAMPDAIEGFGNKRLNTILVHGLGVVSTVLVFYYPEVIYLLPVLTFLYKKPDVPGIVLNLLAIGEGTALLGNMYSLFSVVLYGVAFCVAMLLQSLDDYREALNEGRDYAREYEILLEKKIRSLMESQDSTVLNATLAERNRIAREIHDNVGHMLTRSILQIGAIKIINRDETLRQPIESLHETLNTAMTTIRTSVHDLHDESVDLKHAITEILKTAERFDTDFDAEDGQNLPRNIKYAFIAITKEAVNNAVKHSNGDKISVLVREHPGFYQLMIKDNGSDIPINYNSGIGISNMEERVRQIGGTIKISVNDGFGILVTVIKN